MVGLLLAGSLIAIALGVVPAVLGLLIIASVIAIAVSLIEPMIALGLAIITVSYTHLTLPTILLV